MYGLEINQLATLFKACDPNQKDSDSDDDDQPKKNSNAHLTPANVLSQAQSTAKAIEDTNTTPAKKPPTVNAKDIWQLDEVPESGTKIVDQMDRRIQPEYEMHYKQRISTEDVFLQMGNKNSSSASCEDLVVNIHLPETKLADIILDVTKSFLDCRSPKYLGVASPGGLRPQSSEMGQGEVFSPNRISMSSSLNKRCTSGFPPHPKAPPSGASKPTTTLSRSKTCAFTGATTLKTKADRLQPLPSNRSSSLTDENILDESNRLPPAMVNELILHAKGLQAIPNLSQFSKLQMLDLSCNDLTRIENLKSVPNLRELKLYGNQIGRIENLECLSQLQILQLQYNEIQTIGAGLGNLSRLQMLRLDCNPLSSIRADELGKLVQLKILDVSDCPLENLDFLNNLGSITEFRASHCQLKSLPNPCRHLRYLIDLDLSDNELTTIGPLKSLTSLRVLRLANNRLQEIPILSSLVHLNELDLSNNYIRAIPHTFEKLIELQSLNLAQNRLQTWADIDVLHHLDSLFILAIDGNPCLLGLENYVAQLTKLCPSLEIIDDMNLKTNQSKSLPNESSEELMNIDRELKEVDQSLEQSIAAVQAQFDSIASDLQKLNRLANPPQQDLESSTSKSKHRLFQALTFSEENYAVGSSSVAE